MKLQEMKTRTGTVYFVTLQKKLIRKLNWKKGDIIDETEQNDRIILEKRRN